MTDRAEDLSALARRAALSDEQAAELQALFAAEPEEHFWHQAGTALDQEEAAASALADASARVVERLLSGLPRKKPVLRRYAFVLPAAAAVLLASLAAAAIVAVRHAHEHALAPVLSAPAAPPSAPALGTAQPTQPLTPTPSATPPTTSVANDAPSAPSPASSPAELISAAGRARRSGHASQAVAVLEQLQARFPNSPEASASDISLGKLKLQSGAAGAALQHFNRYLQRAGGGSLAPEALWGRAQALAALGSDAEARKTWAELAQRYPGSPYASLANAKLHGSSVTP